MSMQLAIDRGNSRTKVSVSDGRELATFHSYSDADLAQGLEHLFRQYAITRAIISNVRENQLPATLATCISVPVIQLSTSLSLPFTIGYKTPQTLGHDRLANMAGAAARFPDRNVLVIDCGTCITTSVLVEGVFLGGTISPGLHMRFQALQHFTGKLPEVSPTIPLPMFPGDSTERSIQVGVERGLASEVDSLIKDCRQQFENVEVVITGGDYSFFENSLKSATFASPELTQYGLHEILRINH
jgi:type III pantothenate kinase